MNFEKSAIRNHMATSTHLKAILSSKKILNHAQTESCTESGTNVCSDVQNNSQNKQKQTDSQENRSLPIIKKVGKVPLELWVNARKKAYTWLVYKNGKMFCQVIDNNGNNNS